MFKAWISWRLPSSSSTSAECREYGEQQEDLSWICTECLHRFLEDIWGGGSECSSLTLPCWLDVRAHLNASYQHDHTPVENPSVLVVTTGWTQQGVLVLVATADTNQADYREISGEASERHPLPIERRILTRWINTFVKKKSDSFSVIAKCEVHRCTQYETLRSSCLLNGYGHLSSCPTSQTFNISSCESWNNWIIVIWCSLILLV